MPQLVKPVFRPLPIEMSYYTNHLHKNIFFFYVLHSNDDFLALAVNTVWEKADCNDILVASFFLIECIVMKNICMLQLGP